MAKLDELDFKGFAAETDKAIDKMVYELYGLTEEEVGIIETK
jgi:hypothetical protein